jgi:hypothetical protein
MNVAKPPMPAVASDMDSFVSSVDFAYFRTTLLRMKGRYPAIYGHVAYVDPYIDYVRVEAAVPIRTTAMLVAWSGTQAACYEKWEGFLPKGDA